MDGADLILALGRKLTRLEQQQIGIAYRGSPIVEGAGERYFDDSLRGGRGIVRRFLLMLGEDAGASIIEAAGSWPNDCVKQWQAGSRITLAPREE